MGKAIPNKETFASVCESASSMADAAVKLGMKFTTFKRYASLYGCYQTNQGGKGYKKPSSLKIPLEDILNGQQPQYQTRQLRIRLVKEGIKANQCEICQATDWLGKELTIELHHIDGNPQNHSLDNLQMLCPNCHSQTDNFRGKNKVTLQ